MYIKLQEAYSWTIKDIDESNLVDIFDEIIIMSLQNHAEEEIYIDEIIG